MIKPETLNLVINDVPLKQFLQLFEPSESIHIIELGDIWHPSPGYVDEKIIEECKTVQDLIGFDYDFKGLVIFEAFIGNYKVYYSDSVGYKVKAPKKNIEKLLRKIEAINNSSNPINLKSLN